MIKSTIRKKHIIWHKGEINREHRWALNKHKSALIWITGLPASGKSSIAHALESTLIYNKIRAYVLDGDNIRHGLCKDLGFSSSDRRENIRRVGEVAKLFVDAGIVTIAAFASPYSHDRLMVREMFNKNDFIEVYLKCSLSVCESRDPKGHYRMARMGEIKNFTGISDPYEPPEDPEIILETDKLTIKESVKKIIEYLTAKQII